MSNPSVGVYGKVPAQADFVRVNAGELSRLGYDRWFQEAHEAVHAERGRLPEDVAYFSLAPAGARAVIAGALAPSQDAVGRVFPLIVYATLDAAPLADGFPSLPVSYGRFFAAAAALLADRAGLSVADLNARVGAVAAAVAPDRPEDVMAQLAGERVAPLGLALGGLPHGAAYALRTLITACERTKIAPATPTNLTTVDAPAPTDATRLFWLELLRRKLGWRDTLPSFLWTTGESNRLLVTLGAPVTTLLAFLSNPRHKSGRFWPLRTEVDSALENALVALSPEQRRVLESPGASLADVLVEFG
jgi:type VI secretion system protein ImpM